MDSQTKRAKEQRMVTEMIALYCRKKHHTSRGLCPDCAALAAYAAQRSEACPFMESKTFCSHCKVHCYQPQMREKIRAVMRFAGPRMLFVHPALALEHMLTTRREKRMQEVRK